MTVYASPYGGRCYHSRPNCNGLNATALATWGRDDWSLTRGEAKSRGLTPCRVCKPPPLLTVVAVTDPPHHDCSVHACWRPGCCQPRRPDCVNAHAMEIIETPEEPT